MNFLRRVAVGLSIFAAAALAGPGSAGAAYPGTNGQIVYHSGASLAEYDLWRVSATGTGATKLVDIAGYPSAGPNGQVLFNRIEGFTTPEIYRIPLAGGAETPLTSPPEQNGLGVYTPDATKIVFVRDNGPNLDLFTMDPDGSDKTLLLDTPDKAFEPSVFPDGSRVAYHEGPGLNAKIFSVKMDGSDNQQLTSGNQDYYPDVSPDGRHIVFQRGFGANSEVWKMNADGSGEEALTSHAGIDGRPAFSPDGTRILFERAVTSSSDTEIFSMDIDGNDLQQVTTTPVASGNPSWAPVQGSSLPPAECSDGDDNDGNGRADFPEDSGCEDALDRLEAGGGTDGKVDARLSAAKKQRGGKVKLELFCADGCTAKLSGKVKLKQGRKRSSVKLANKKLSVSAGDQRAKKLKPKGKQKKKLKRALKKRAKATAKMKAKVTDADGDKVTLKAKVKLKK